MTNIGMHCVSILLLEKVDVFDKVVIPYQRTKLSETSRIHLE